MVNKSARLLLGIRLGVGLLLYVGFGPLPSNVLLPTPYRHYLQVGEPAARSCSAVSLTNQSGCRDMVRISSVRSMCVGHAGLRANSHRPSDTDQLTAQCWRLMQHKVAPF